MTAPRPGTRLIQREDGAPALILQPAKLEIVRGTDRGRSAAVERTTLTVGTDAACDLVLVDDAVSARHFELVTGEHGCLLRDLGSTNGTFLDGYRAREVWLRDGAEIVVGQTALRFTLAPGEVEIPISRATNFGELLGHSAPMRAAFAVLE